MFIKVPTGSCFGTSACLVFFGPQTWPNDNHFNSYFGGQVEITRYPIVEPKHDPKLDTRVPYERGKNWTPESFYSLCMYVDKYTYVCCALVNVCVGPSFSTPQGSALRACLEVVAALESAPA